MVSIEKPHKKKSKLDTLPVILIALTLFAMLLYIFDNDAHPVTAESYRGSTASQRSVVSLEANFGGDGKSDILSRSGISNANAKCPYMTIADLTPEERHPHAGDRHMITPPEGGLLHLVCCQTTKGPFNTLVHEKWAAKGAQRFLSMVKSGYFNAGVPLMRCLKGFLCQFGLNTNPKLSKEFQETIGDDPNWLPEGPKYKTNAKGVARFAVGYMAYAGGGKHSRDNQLIVSLDNVPTLAGGSPWEVPWGELVGKHSFETLSRFYTGYGEDGPQQGDMWNKGVTDSVRKKFPLLDYINSCAVVDQEIQEVKLQL